MVLFAKDVPTLKEVLASVVALNEENQKKVYEIATTTDLSRVDTKEMLQIIFICEQNPSSIPNTSFKEFNWNIGENIDLSFTKHTMTKDQEMFTSQLLKKQRLTPQIKIISSSIDEEES